MTTSMFYVALSESVEMYTVHERLHLYLLFAYVYQRWYKQDNATRTGTK